MTIAHPLFGSLAALLSLFASAGCARENRLDEPTSPLRLERKIELPQVRGRIDHMALDVGGDRLFVAEYGNGSVDEIDLSSGQVIGRIGGLHEPQGVGWLARQQEIAVACGDGTVRFYRAADRQQVAAIDLGDDADDVRIDNRNGDLVVGYGSGGLAVIDPAARRLVGELKLPAHPEGFAIVGARVFVNVPDAHEIAIGDLGSRRIIARLATGRPAGNYPMASDSAGTRIAIGYRSIPSLAVVDAQAGRTIFTVPACGDADDVYFRRRQVVIICGVGDVELVGEDPPHRSVRVPTERGARTGLLDLSGDHLFVAAPAGGRPAAIWELSFAQARHKTPQGEQWATRERR